MSQSHVVRFIRKNCEVPRKWPCGFVGLMQSQVSNPIPCAPRECTPLTLSPSTRTPPSPFLRLMTTFCCIQVQLIFFPSTQYSCVVFSRNIINSFHFLPQTFSVDLQNIESFFSFLFIFSITYHSSYVIFSLFFYFFFLSITLFCHST